MLHKNQTLPTYAVIKSGVRIKLEVSQPLAAWSPNSFNSFTVNIVHQLYKDVDQYIVSCTK